MPHHSPEGLKGGFPLPLTRPLLAWLKSLCSTSLCRTDQALAVFSDWDSKGRCGLTPRPQPWFRDRMGGTGWLAPQQGPPSLTVGWGWRGVKPVPKRNPQVRLPTLLPLSLSPPLSLLSRGSTHRRPRRQRRRSRVLTAASQMATRTGRDRVNEQSR